VPDSRAWWNRAAHDARSYVATAPDPFFDRGRRDTDELVAFCGLEPSKNKTLLEIGAGVGRMTRRFAQLYGRVIALDVVPDRSVDDVFSYITLQHVPSVAAVLRYLQDASRVLRLGGQGALQVRQPGLMPWAADLAGHLVHAAQGRRVWGAEWRGTRIPARMLLQAASGSDAGPSCGRAANATYGCCSGADGAAAATASWTNLGRGSRFWGARIVDWRGAGASLGSGVPAVRRLGAVDEGAQVMP
jgi:hypothetical protein